MVERPNPSHQSEELRAIAEKEQVKVFLRKTVNIDWAIKSLEVGTGENIASWFEVERITSVKYQRPANLKGPVCGLHANPRPNEHFSVGPRHLKGHGRVQSLAVAPPRYLELNPAV